MARVVSYSDEQRGNQGWRLLSLKAEGFMKMPWQEEHDDRCDAASFYHQGEGYGTCAPWVFRTNAVQNA